jgi:hypothetical protein
VVLALPSLDGYLRTALKDLIESASQASMILLRAWALHPCFPVAWRSQNRPGAGNASGWRSDGALERASVRGRCLAAVILVFWSQLTAVVALLIAVVLLVMPGLTGGPPLRRAAGQEAAG